MYRAFCGGAPSRNYAHFSKTLSSPLILDTPSSLKCSLLIKKKFFSTFESNDLYNTVRARDYDNYLLGLLYPKEFRTAFFCLRAFNIEIASIKESTNGNTMASLIRLQWWRDSIQELYLGKPSFHPLLSRIGSLIEQHNLTKRWFDRYFSGREVDIHQEGIATLDEMENYAENTSSSLLYLMLECLDVREDPVDIAASHAGVAIGLTTLLRGTPHHLASKFTYLPNDLLEKNGILMEDIANGLIDRQRLADVVFQVACQAQGQLQAARDKTKEIPLIARPLFLSTVATSMTLETLEKVNFDIFDPSFLQRKQIQQQLRLLKLRFQSEF